MSRSIRMELPSLAKEGWPRHQVNGPVPLKGGAGVVRSTSDNRWLERTTLPCFALSGSHSLRSCPSAPAKEASLLFHNGRSHPSFAKTLPRRGVPFGCFATFIEKSAHPEFLEVRRSEVVPPLTGLAPNANRTPRAHARG